MKARGGAALLGITAAACFLGTGCSKQSDPPVPVTLPPLPDPPDEAFRAAAPIVGERDLFTPPAVDRFTLPGGIDVVLVERHRLPVINWSLEFPAGTVTDPMGQEGRAALCMYLFVQGGAGNAVDQLADMGSEIYTSTGLESAELDGFSLRDDFDRTLDLWAGVLNHPGVSSWSLDRLREEYEGRLLQSIGDPGGVAWRVFQIAARGPEHPYARRPSVASYGNVTVDDCQNFYREFVQVRGLHLYVAGDITHDEVAQKFAPRIPTGPIGAPEPFIPGSSRDGTAVTFVNMPGASQAEILMWGPAPSLDAADYNAAWTMLSILAGNSITSRLGSDLREMMGSTYSVQGKLTSWKDDTWLTVEVPVQNDKTAAAMMAMVTGAAMMRETDVTDDELSLVRDGAIAALPSQFATVSGTLDAFRRLVYYGLPATYFQDLPGKLAAVDKAAIRQAANDYLPRLGLQFVVVGDATAVLPMLVGLTAPDGALPGTLRTVDVEGQPVNLR